MHDGYIDNTTITIVWMVTLPSTITCNIPGVKCSKTCTLDTIMVKYWSPMDSPHKGPVMQSFGDFFLVSLNKLWWFNTCNVTSLHCVLTWPEEAGVTPVCVNTLYCGIVGPFGACSGIRTFIYVCVEMKKNIPKSLTHCGLVTPYGGEDLGHQWFRYLYQWWLIISEAQIRSPQGNFTRDTSAINH